MGKQIAFWSPVHGQVGTSANLISAACMIGLESSARTLIGHTHGAMSGLESVLLKSNSGLFQDGFDNSGLDALERLARNHRLSSERVKDYTRPILHNRLDLLMGTSKTDEAGQAEISGLIEGILMYASQYYDLIMIDINRSDRNLLTNKVLETSDLIVVNLNQNMALLERYFEHVDMPETIAAKPKIFVLGQYDHGSKYKVSNIARRFRCRNEMFTVPYCVDFLDACNDRNVVEFMLRLNSIHFRHPNYFYRSELRKLVKAIFKTVGIEHKLLNERGA